MKPDLGLDQDQQHKIKFVKKKNASGENIPAFIEKYRDVSDFGLKWDVIKMEIRSFTVQYSKRTTRSEKDKDNQLLIKLNDLEEKLCSSRNDLNLLNEYYTLKAKLEKLSNKKTKGTYDFAQ